MATKITISSKENQMKTAAADREPGSTPDYLRRRMSQLYADFFSELGEGMYADALAQSKAAVEQVMREGIKNLKERIKDELGRQGYEAAIKHVRPWLEALIDDIRTKGFSTTAGTRVTTAAPDDSWGDMLDSLASEFSVDTPEPVESKEGEELVGVEPPADEPESEIPKPPAELKQDTAKEEPAAAEEAKEVAKEETEPVDESELEKILNQGAKPAAEQPKAAARTLGDLKRDFTKRRQQRKVEGSTDEIISQSNALIDLLEG